MPVLGPVLNAKVMSYLQKISWKASVNMDDNRGIQIGALWMADVMLAIVQVCAADTIYTQDRVDKFKYLYPAVLLSEHTMFSSDFCEQILALNFSVPSHVNELNRNKLSLFVLECTANFAICRHRIKPRSSW